MNGNGGEIFHRQGTEWIQRQRDKFRNEGRPLQQDEKERLSPYFAGETLDSVRAAYVPEIENPDFYRQLQEMGQPIPLDFSAMWGITFMDTIVAATSRAGTNPDFWIYLLFHECVHVCQYNQLGLRSYMERYVLGWAQRGFKYRNIPMEGHAYSLQYQFETGGHPSSVEESIRDWLRMN